MFSIDSFKANLAPVRPNLFFAEITLPPAIFSIENRNKVQGSANLQGRVTSSTALSAQALSAQNAALQRASWWTSVLLDDTNVNGRFRFRCEATELPGRTIATTDETNSYGPNLKYAYDHTYSDHTFQIIASEDMYERRIFEVWMDNIVYATDRSGGMTSKAGIIRYYDDYALGGECRIYQVNDQSSQIARYTLFNAYPIALSPMNLTWEEQNTYQRFTVTMTYRYHISDFENKTLSI
jgi:hypothetical protein